jgi:hypothetical protein
LSKANNAGSLRKNMAKPVIRASAIAISIPPAQQYDASDIWVCTLLVGFFEFYLKNLKLI